jgi:hypothetical protein
MLYFKIIEGAALRYDVLEEEAQGRDVPLAVAQFIDKRLFRCLRGDAERLII